MPKSLGQLILSANLKTIAFIGLAKNAGKTTALNKASAEIAAAGSEIAVLSYGLDGEKRDYVTRKEKPAVVIPQGGYFVTAEEALLTHKTQAQEISSTDIITPRGKVKVYQAVDNKLEVELTGINRTSDLKKARAILEPYCDFILIDGALDRKSSGLPEISAAIIVSTGAVLGSNVKKVADKTALELTFLKLAGLKEDSRRKEFSKLITRARQENFAGWLIDEVQQHKFTSQLSLNLAQELKELISQGNNYKFLLLAGAFTDELAKVLISRNNTKKMTVVIKDSTKIFLSARNFRLLQKKEITVKVVSPLKVLAITVNPHNPEGRNLASEELMAALKRLKLKLPLINVCKSN